MAKCRSDEVSGLVWDRTGVLLDLVAEWNLALEGLAAAERHEARLEARLAHLYARIARIEPRKAARARHRLAPGQNGPVFRGDPAHKCDPLVAARLLACQGRIAQAEAEMAPELAVAADRVAEARSQLQAVSRRLLAVTGPGEAEALTGRSRPQLAHITH